MLADSSTFSRKLLRWFDRAQRTLPWRVKLPGTGRPDPYQVLLSELMLQQTQVATVIPYFHRFLERFPTLVDLAAAPQQDVLRLWQGLGYYSRARNLHAAAQAVMRDHAGVIPHTVEKLLELPGIGRYTAGAIASIAFDRRAPILDGNVQRVLCRLDAIEQDPRDRVVAARLWKRAEELLPKRRIGDFNSALMELGAMICTPRNPQCLLCPVRENCKAFAGGLQEKIPLVKKSKPTPLFHRRTYCIRNGERWLIEQRPAKGRWAGMWQFVTVDAGDSSIEFPLRFSTPQPLIRVAHALTHRRYAFEVFICEAAAMKCAEALKIYQWVTLAELDEYPLPRPHVKIAVALRERFASANL